MKIRRLGLVLLAVPCAFAAYACSSDESGTTDTDAGDDGSTVTNPDGSPPGNDGSTGTDSGKDAGDSGIKDGGDGGDSGAVSLVCIGNPLTADGGDAGPNGFTVDAAALTQIVDELAATGNASAFADGPQWIDLDGGSYLAYSELYTAAPTLVRIQPDGGARSVLRSSTNGGPFFIGNAFFDGGIYSTVSSAGGGSLAVTLPDGGQLGDLAISPSTNPNDLVIAPTTGSIYFTDPHYQAAPTNATGIYRRDAAGAVTMVVSSQGTPNGIALSLDSTKLYISITDSQKIVSYALGAGGVLPAPNTVTTLVGATVDAPDGMAIDSGGNLWVAESATGGAQSGRVEVFSSTGTKLGEIPFPDQRPTGLAFGGNDKRTLFITTEHRIYKYTNRCAGTY